MNWSKLAKAGLLSTSLFLLPALSAGQSAIAASGDQLDRQTTDLVKSVQTALTMQGKWPPPAGSPEMQLCSALQAFTQEVKRAPDLSAMNRGNASGQQMAAQRLSASAAQVDSLIGSVAGSADVSSRWFTIKNQINAASGYVYGAVPGVWPGNPVINPNIYTPGLSPEMYNPAINPGMYNPGLNPGIYNPVLNPGAYNPAYNPNGYYPGTSGQPANLNSYVSSLDSELRSFSSYLQKSLMQGGFANSNQNNLFALTAALQNLQSTVKASGNSIANSRNLAQQQQGLQQISLSLSQFEQQFNAAQPNAMVNARYMQFKNSFTALQQAVFGNGMLMR